MADEQPWVRVERGAPTAEEVAALVAALSVAQARRAAADGPAGGEGSAWARAARAGLRAPDDLPPPGPGAWRLSALPTRR